MQDQQPRLSLLVLAIVALAFLGGLFWMIQNHNRGANLQPPPAAAGP